MAKLGLRRNSIKGVYARGEETRAAIISAALELFSLRGFTGVSTREIAAAANVPAPSLQYYFGSKDDLYNACVTHIQAEIIAALGPALDAAEAALKKSCSVSRLIEAYCFVLDNLADFLLKGPDAARRALFLSRIAHAMGDRDGKPDVGNAVAGRLFECTAKLVSAISAHRLPAGEAQLIASTINGQVFAIHLGRGNLKLITGSDILTPKRVDSLKRAIRRQTPVILEDYARRAR
jgi:TetR/AcrR family transcriptional regulator, regulator of cefoperazone and chloramphenicol sensitivity